MHPISCAAGPQAPAAARASPSQCPRHARPAPATARRQPLPGRTVSRAGFNIDWSDPDTLTGVLGGVLGLGVGIAAPIFYISRDNADEKKLEELRALNRKTFEETGEYMSEEEIAAYRTPRWTDRREFQDDD